MPKKNYLFLVGIFIFLNSINAQVTETFETATVGNSSFTNGAFTGTFTPNGVFKVSTIPGNYGYLSSANYVENANANACSITSATTFKAGSIYLYPSSDGGSTNQTASVSVTFTGKLGGVTKFTYSPPAADFTSASWSNTTNRGFSLVNFATPGHQNIIIDELVIDIGGSGNYIAIDNFTFTTAVATPTITTTGTLTAFTTCAGTASSQQSFTVSGSNLTANIVVTPPTGFEVSTTSGSGFASNVTLTQSGGTVNTTTIYTRLTTTATGTPSGNITCASSGATTQNVTSSGTVNALPTITLGINPSICNGTTSASLTYSATTGSPNQYSITWSAGAIIAGFSNLSNTSLPASPISITIPSNPGAGTYNTAANSFTVRNSITGCVSTGTNFGVVVNASTTWNGTTWSNCTPSSSVDAIIASSTAPTSFICKALNINSTFALTTTGITATVNGNITNNGNGIAGTGGLTIAANSTISGSNINFNGTLTVNSGAVLTTGGLLTLTSNATNTARVAAGATAGGYISGNVTVQKFIAGGVGRRKFRFLGHPFTTMNLTELSNDIDITGAITGSNLNQFSATTTSNPSAFTFTESAGNAATGTTNNTGWTALTSGNSITIINGGQGIRALVRGPKGQTGVLLANPPAPNDVTLSLTGALRQGDFTQNLSFTDAARGWNLISNPYASNIDWNVIRASNLTNVNDAIYTYRPALSGGNYGTYINGSAANGGSQYIEAYSSFLVRANAASPTIAWQEADKVSNNPTNTVFRTAQTINNRISLTLKNTITQDTDEVVLRFGDDPATDLFDGKYDAENLAGASQDLYVLDQNQQAYSIYHGSALKDAATEKRVVLLGINNLVAGNYSLEATTLNAFVGNHKAYLKDNETNELIEIKDNTNYSFTVSSTQNNYNRFSIVFNAKKQLPAVSTVSSFDLKLSPNPAKDMVTINFSNVQQANTTITFVNAEGKTVKTIQAGNVQTGVQRVNVKDLAKGIYYVTLNNGTDKKTEKLVIQ